MSALSDEVAGWLDKVAVVMRRIDAAAEGRTGDGSPEARQARSDYLDARGEWQLLMDTFRHQGVHWLSALVGQVALAESRTTVQSMRYGHPEETLVQLIREQAALIAHLVHSAERRRWPARPNGTQLIAHQRARSLEKMAQHMGLVTIAETEDDR